MDKKAMKAISEMFKALPYYGDSASKEITGIWIDEPDTFKIKGTKYDSTSAAYEGVKKASEQAIIPKKLWGDWGNDAYASEAMEAERYYMKKLYAEEKRRRWDQYYGMDYGKEDAMAYMNYNTITTRQPTQEDRWIAVMKKAFAVEIKDLPYKLLDIRIYPSYTIFETIVELRVQTMCNQMGYKQVMAKELTEYRHIPVEQFLIEIVKLAVRAAIDHDAEHINDD